MRQTKIVAIALGAVGLAVGLVMSWHWLSFLGLLTVGVGSSLLFRQHQRQGETLEPIIHVDKAPAADEPSDETGVELAEGEDTDSLVTRLTQQKRYALLVLPQVACTLDEEHLAAAREVLDDAMSIVPSGDVFVSEPDFEEPSEHANANEQEPELVHVEAIHLDRYQVTNRDFQLFVDDGGYEQVSFWDPDIWPAVLEFIDQTGYPGPKFWLNGRFPQGKGDHPVVGVSWFEAQAYSHWVGKRLPTSAEWVKAGAWPVAAAGSEPIQRKYPWGDTMDRKLANLWGGEGDTVSIHNFEDGVSVGGAHQLIGNVWEWTLTDFVLADKRLIFDAPLKTIHGGAFDTYFDGHATCQFRSGESPLSRKRNIGFRCAIGICDINTSYSPVEDEEAFDDEHDVVMAGDFEEQQ